MSAPTLDLAETPLAPGRLFVEASAGTGKTYSLVGLVLRLLTEHGLEPGQILAVTFTRAATAELRQRLRQRLRAAAAGPAEALAWPELQPSLRRHGPAETARRLRRAAAAAEGPAVRTIDGFCAETLRSYPAATGLPADFAVTVEPAEHLERAAEDVFRRRLYEAPAEIGWACALAELTPADLHGPVRRAARAGRVLHEPPLPPRSAVEAAWTAHANRLLAALEARAPEDFSALGRSNGAKRQEALRRAYAQWDGALPSKAAMKAFVEALAPTKTRKFVSRTDLGTILEAHDEALQAWEEGMLGHLAEEAAAAFAANLEAAGLLTPDGLRRRLLETLAGPAGEAVRHGLRERFRAVLVDEFQDTDPLQERLFREVFGAGDGHWLICVGDPKQSIYRFRGADLPTYQRALAGAQRVTLGTNFRSAPALVEAFNRLFGPAFAGTLEAPALAAGAPAGPVAVPDRPPGEVLLVHRAVPEPNQTARRAAALAWAVDRVRALLGAGLRPGEIALLARRNEDIRTLRAGLLAAGFAAVSATDEDLLRTDEAAAGRRLLTALLNPRRRSGVRAVLVGSPCFCPLDELDRRTPAFAEGLAEWAERWRAEGFAAAFAAFWRETEADARLLSRPGGERAWANWGQWAEFLTLAEHAGATSPEALLRTLDEAARAPAGEARALRPERSDDRAVRLLTIHRAKGLQFPAVLLPFLATGSHPKPPALAEQWAGDGALRVLRGAAAAEVEGAASEAEELRLAYVAMTRAERRLELFWPEGAPKDGPGLLGQLFGGVPGSAGWLDRGWAEAPGVGVADWPAGPAPVTPPPPPPPALAAAPPNPAAYPRIVPATSFSALKGEKEHRGEGRATPRPSAGDLPGGTHVGHAVHAVFERADWAAPGPPVALAEAACREFGLDPAWAPAVAGLVHRALRHPLPWGGACAALAPADLAREVPFAFAATLGEEPPLPPGTLVEGVIDAVVRVGGAHWIVDWKTNLLPAYTAPVLAKAMAETDYLTQAALYRRALARALGPGTRPAGVVYVFLRGLDPAHPGRGLWWAGPDGREVRR